LKVVDTGHRAVPVQALADDLYGSLHLLEFHPDLAGFKTIFGLVGNAIERGMKMLDLQEQAIGISQRKDLLHHMLPDRISLGMAFIYDRRFAQAVHFSPFDGPADQGTLKKNDKEDNKTDT